MDQDGLSARLRAIPLFAQLDDAALARVASTASEFDAPSGHVLVQAREPGYGLFVIEEGTVAVELKGRTIELGPGEFFGELSLLVPGATRTARVRATTPARLIALARPEATRLIEDEPPVTLAMLRTLAKRLLDEVTA